MKHYLTINDLPNVQQSVKDAITLKQDPLAHQTVGKNKTIVLLFFNSSLRTRLSTEKAAQNLGMNVMVMNISNAWNLEFEDGTVMNLDKAEHIKEAAAVVSQYADIIAVRAFPSLNDKAKDETEYVLSAFAKYATVPIVNMESATAHPLQSLTDAITILEQGLKRPKVVLSWAPHPKALPHAVANSFIKTMQSLDVDFCITHPKGYDLNPDIVKDTIVYDKQEEAFEGADFVYAKNWSNYNDYGQVLNTDPNWMITLEQIKQAKFMHCLPVRRNVVIEDAVLDSSQSLTTAQANNRTYAAQYVLKTLLEQQ